MDCLIGCFAFCVFIAVTRYILDQEQDIKKKNSKSRKKRKQNSEETEGRCIFNDSLSETLWKKKKKKSKRTFKVTLINLLKFNAMDEPESDYCTTMKYTEGESDVDM